MIDHGFKYNMNITYLQRYCLNTIVTEYYGFCASLCNSQNITCKSVQKQQSVSSQFQALLLNNEKCSDDF